jgi:prefoldin subunit 5
MDISNKIREKKQELDEVVAEERLLRTRIAELKTIIAEHQKHQETLEKLKAEEAELLKQLD